MNALEGTVTHIIPALVARGWELAEEQRRKEREQQDQRTAYEQERATTDLVDALAELLGITVDRSAITVTLDQPEWGRSVFASVEVEGYRFAYGDENQYTTRYRARDLQALLIERVCSRNCEHPLWVAITPRGYDQYGREPLAQLHDAIKLPQAHQWPCLMQYDGEGNPITDAMGHPLPKPAPRAPTAAEVHDRKTDVYANLVKLRRQLQFDKAIEKEEAIGRLLASGVAKSATAAEKMVETDVRYKTLCATLTETIVQEIRAKEELLVARALRTGITERVGGPEDAP